MVNNRARNGGRDDYFTSKHYANKVVDWLAPCLPENYWLIEPAAGNGVLLDALTHAGHVWHAANDIYPLRADIREQDFFDIEVLPENTVVFTNPPFGHACSLAVRFFNHAASLNATIIALIVPLTFRKASIKRRLDNHYKKVLDRLGPKNGFILPQTQEPYHVPTCFQVWKRVLRPIKRKVGPLTSPYFSFVKDTEQFDWCVKRCGGSAGQIIEEPERMDSDSDYFIRAVCGYKEQVGQALIAADFAKHKDRTAGTRSLSKRELIAETHKILVEFIQ